MAPGDAEGAIGVAMSHAPAGSVTTRTQVLLVRHAEVENRGGLFYGRLPGFGLSALGRQQAEALAGALTDEPFTAMYHSPLLRAEQTAAIIAQRHPGLVLQPAAQLLEVRSSWMGACFADVPIGVNLYEPPRSEDDETIPDLAGRMTGFVTELAERHAGQTVCCVSHGDPIAAAAAHYRGDPLTLVTIRWHFPAVCSVTRVGIATPSSDPPAPEVEHHDVLSRVAPALRTPRGAASR